VVTSGAIGKIRSALARPLDRNYPTNLAVMILAPSAALALGGLALWQKQSVLTALETAVRGALTAFGGWALAREIAPDDNPAAFVSLGLALVAILAIPQASVLPLFTALMLARIVNRSVGIPATLVDSIAVAFLAAWTASHTGNGGPLIVASVAFGLDAMLARPLRRQWIFAILCLIAGVAVLFSARAATGDEVTVSSYVPIVIIGLGYAIVFFRTRMVRSVGDLSGETLDAIRVRAAMAVAGLIAGQGALVGGIALDQSSIVWAVLAGLPLMAIFRPIVTDVLT
jgi:hypothetical protein